MGKRPRHRQQNDQRPRRDVGGKTVLQTRAVTAALLIASDGFYERRTEGSVRQPMHIRRKDGDLFAFAGLWEEWKHEDGTPLRICTIITVDLSNLMAAIHNQMPAPLRG